MAAASTRPPSALWPPSSQSSLSLGSEPREAALDDALQAPRPIRTGEAGLEGRRLELLEAGRAQGCDGGAGVDVLMTADEARFREVEQAFLVLVDETSALLVDREILRADEDGRRADALGLALAGSGPPGDSPEPQSPPGSRA